MSPSGFTHRCAHVVHEGVHAASSRTLQPRCGPGSNLLRSAFGHRGNPERGSCFRPDIGKTAGVDCAHSTIRHIGSYAFFIMQNTFSVWGNCLLFTRGIPPQTAAHHRSSGRKGRLDILVLLHPMHMPKSAQKMSAKQGHVCSRRTCNGGSG